MDPLTRLHMQVPTSYHDNGLSHNIEEAMPRTEEPHPLKHVDLDQKLYPGRQPYLCSQQTLTTLIPPYKYYITTSSLMNWVTQHLLPLQDKRRRVDHHGRQEPSHTEQLNQFTPLTHFSLQINLTYNPEHPFPLSPSLSNHHCLGLQQASSPLAQHPI